MSRRNKKKSRKGKKMKKETTLNRTLYDYYSSLPTGFSNMSEAKGSEERPRNKTERTYLIMDMQAIQKISELCLPKASSNEFQVSYEGMRVEFVKGNLKVNFMIPLVYYNYPQEVTSSTIDSELDDQTKMFEEASKIFDKDEIFYPMFKLLEPFRNAGYETNFTHGDFGSIHRHPGKMTFSGTDLRNDPKRPGIIFRKNKFKAVQVDSILYIAGNNPEKSEIFHSEARRFDIEPEEGTSNVNGWHEEHDCITLLFNKDGFETEVNVDFSKFLNMEEIEDSINETVKHWIVLNNKSTVEHEDNRLASFMMLTYQAMGFEPDISLVDPENIKAALLSSYVSSYVYPHNNNFSANILSNQTTENINFEDSDFIDYILDEDTDNTIDLVREFVPAYEYLKKVENHLNDYDKEPLSSGFPEGLINISQQNILDKSEEELEIVMTYYDTEVKFEAYCDSYYCPTVFGYVEFLANFRFGSVLEHSECYNGIKTAEKYAKKAVHGLNMVFLKEGTIHNRSYDITSALEYDIDEDGISVELEKITISIRKCTVPSGKFPIKTQPSENELKTLKDILCSRGLLGSEYSDLGVLYDLNDQVDDPYLYNGLPSEFTKQAEYVKEGYKPAIGKFVLNCVYDKTHLFQAFGSIFSEESGDNNDEKLFLSNFKLLSKYQNNNVAKSLIHSLNEIQANNYRSISGGKPFVAHGCEVEERDGFICDLIFETADNKRLEIVLQEIDENDIQTMIEYNDYKNGTNHQLDKTPIDKFRLLLGYKDNSNEQSKTVQAATK